MKAKKGNGPSLQSGEITLKHQGMHRPYSFFLGVFLLFVGVASLASTSFATNSFHMTSTPSDNFNSYKFQENFFQNSDRLFEMGKEDGDSGRSGRHNTRRHHRNPTTNINALTKARKPESDLFAEDMDDLLVESDSTVRLAPKHNLNYTWPIRELASLVDGDITIGALHMIHERSEEYGCGRIMDQGGIQALEVMLYTLDHINGKYGQPLIPGVHLGVLAKDDCDTDIYGLEQALDFIRGSITNIGGSSYKCKDGLPPENKVKVISGVIGAPSSQTSIQVANLLKLFRIPQISFFSTSPVLSNRDRFPYFFRTIPSDLYQAEAIVSLVTYFKWKYVSIVYEESSYGQQGFNEVELLLRKTKDICIALREKLLKDSGVPTEQDYDKIVFKLLEKEFARGVIVFASDQEVAGLMRAVRRNDATGKFAWIGSDGWGARGLAFKGNEPELEGAVTVQPIAEEVKGFKEYFLNLTPTNNKRNPWFGEYWEDHFNCRYNGTPQTPYNHHNRTCTGDERITPGNFMMEAQLQFVSDSIMAFSYAFKEIHQKLCGSTRGVCDAMLTKMSGEYIKTHLHNVKFTGLSGQEFQFGQTGDGPSLYRILNFRKTEKGDYEWATVGFYRDAHLNITKAMKFRSSEPEFPTSVCSSKCGMQQYMEYIPGEPCCWYCKDCSAYEYRPVESRCEECPPGMLPSENMTDCIEIPPIYLRYTDAIALAAMAFASIGILATTATAIIFLKHNDTPVVKASGRELSFVLLFGIFLCYVMTFLLVSKPTKYVCGSQTVGIGFCFSVCYSAILTKTNRISRIFRAGKRTVKRPKFISPESQLIICASLVACQIIVSLIWLLTSPPKAMAFYARRDDHQLVCEAAIGFAYMIGFSYPIFLVLVCTVYAVITRKIPEAFNESKYIGFTMYTTCIIWAAFVVIYLSTSHNIQVRIATMCFSISLSATVALICMFTPKLYIILFRPERNVRKSMMGKNANVKLNNCSPGGRIDSGTQSDDFEMTRTLRSSGSFSSGYSRSTNATQTYSNGHSISTQTLDSVGDPRFGDDDVEL